MATQEARIRMKPRVGMSAGVRALGFAVLTLSTAGCGQDKMTAPVEKAAEATTSPEARPATGRAQRPRGPGQANVVAGPVSVRASVNSYCLRSEGGAGCADSTGGVHTPPLRVSGRAKVRLRFGAEARRVRAWLAQERDERWRAEARVSPYLNVTLHANGTVGEVQLPRRFARGARLALRFDVLYRRYRGDAVLFGAHLGSG